MKNVWTKIKEWFKKNWAIVAAAIGGFFAAVFAGLCSSKRRRLDTDNKLCESAESGVAKVTESVDSATRKLDAAEGTVGELKQSIATSEVRLDESADTVGKLLRDTETVKGIIDKYNK